MLFQTEHKTTLRDASCGAIYLENTV